MKICDWNRRQYKEAIQSRVRSAAGMRLPSKPTVSLLDEFLTEAIEAACTAIDASPAFSYDHSSDKPLWKYRICAGEALINIYLRVDHKYKAVPPQMRTVRLEECPHAVREYFNKIQQLEEFCTGATQLLQSVLHQCTTVNQLISVIPVAPKLFGVDTGKLKRARRTKVKGMNEEEAAAARKLGMELAVVLKPVQPKWSTLEAAYIDRWSLPSA